MNQSDWKYVQYFNHHEFPDPEKMDLEFMMILDSWRKFIKKPVIITSSTDGKHEDNSYHYQGLACDVMCLSGENMTVLDLFFSAVRFDFTGIGIYPQWRYNNNEGQIIAGGLHVDRRPIKHREKKALWIGVKIDGQQTYLPLTEQNLRQFKAIR